MLKLKFTLIVFLSFHVVGKCYNVGIPEIEEQLKHETSETKVIDLLNTLSRKYFSLDIHKSYSCAQDAYLKSEKINYPNGKALGLANMALYYAYTGERMKTIEYNKRALEISESLNEDSLTCRILNNLGYAYYNIGLNDKALEFYFQGLPYAEKNKQYTLNVVLLENISNIFELLGDKEKEKFYYRRAGEVARQSSDSLLHYIPDMHLAKAANKDGDYLLANKHFTLSLSKTYINSHKAYVLTQFADSKKLQKDYTDAEIKIKKAIALYDESSNIEKLIDTKIELIHLYNHMSRYEESLKIVSELLTDYELKNTKKNITLQLHISAAEAYQQLGKHKKANESYKEALEIKDYIFDQQTIKTVASLDIKYNLKEKEQENYFLRSQQEKSALISSQQKKIVASTSLLLFLVSLISVLLFKANKQKNKFNEKLSEEVDNKTTELQKTNLQLKESNIELERFAHIASHDLKEPLRNILSFSQLLERSIKIPGSKDDLIEYATFIQRNAKQMNSLIEDVLEFSREGSHSLVIDKIDTQKLLSTVQELLDYEVKKRNAIINISAEIPEIHGFKTQLLLVFKNLIMNGIKYNQHEQPQVDLTYQEIDGFHHFYIKDNGIGIESEYHVSIFEMFKRLHNRSDYEGSGLGLAFCRKVVNKMGGKIWLEESNSGSCFIFTIPVGLRTTTQSSRFTTSKDSVGIQ